MSLRLCHCLPTVVALRSGYLFAHRMAWCLPDSLIGAISKGGGDMLSRSRVIDTVWLP